MVTKALLRILFFSVTSICHTSLFAQSETTLGDCFTGAAGYQQVNKEILMSIAIKESTNCKSIISRNRNNTSDYGCMQINSIHLNELAKFGISTEDLLNQCKNIYVGAWQYKKKVLKHGNNWTAVGAYHSESKQERDLYASQVYEIWKKYFGGR